MKKYPVTRDEQILAGERCAECEELLLCAGCEIEAEKRYCSARCGEKAGATIHEICNHRREAIRQAERGKKNDKNVKPDEDKFHWNQH